MSLDIKKGCGAFAAGLSVQKDVISSVEIAEITGKEHRNVMRDIRKQFEELGIGALRFEQTYLDAQNKEQPCYCLDKEQSLILASGYNVLLRSKIVSRWVELEQTQVFDPSKLSRRDLILIALESEDRVQELEDKTKVQEKVIEEQKPAVAFVEAVKVSENSILIRELAHKITCAGYKIGEKRLYAWMRENGFICQKSTEPTQRALEQGLFEILTRTIQKPAEMVTCTTTKVTGKGQCYFIKKFQEEAAAESQMESV